MADRIIGRAYFPGMGLCFVEAGASSTCLTVRSMSTGEARYMKRELVQWR